MPASGIVFFDLVASLAMAFGLSMMAGVAQSDDIDRDAAPVGVLIAALALSL